MSARSPAPRIVDFESAYKPNVTNSSLPIAFSFRDSFSLRGCSSPRLNENQHQLPAPEVTFLTWLLLKRSTTSRWDPSDGTLQQCKRGRGCGANVNIKSSQSAGSGKLLPAASSRGEHAGRGRLSHASGVRVDFSQGCHVLSSPNPVDPVNFANRMFST